MGVFWDSDFVIHLQYGHLFITYYSALDNLGSMTKKSYIICKLVSAFKTEIMFYVGTYFLINTYYEYNNIIPI